MPLSDLLGSDSSDPSWIKEHKSPASKASKKRKGDAKDEVTSGLKEDKKKTKAVQSRNQIHVIDSGSSSDEDDDLTLKALSSQNQNQNQNEQKKKKGRGGGKNVISIDQRKDVDASDSEQQPIQITQEETEVEEQEPINLTQLTQETSAYSAGIKNTQDSLGTEVTGRRRDKKGGGGGGGKQAAQPNDLVLMVPEKFLKTKVLVQFEKDSESLDLSGDFGAVGRFLVSKHEAEDNAAAKTATEDRTVDDQVEIRMDLKGQLYNCRLMPTCTTMVISTQGGEAKVESIATDVMKLERDMYTQQGQHIDSSAFLEPPKQKKQKT